MKFKDLEKLSPLERREFLTSLSGFLALPMLPKATYEAVYEIVFGQEAVAQSAQPINLIEINFRDQWDWGHLFVPPSVARSYDSLGGRIALFDRPIQERRNFYVTPQAAELRPHLDSIAVMELGDCTLSGNESIHGHEAGNPLRSPGRSKQSAAGKIDMATSDRRPGTGGNEILYSSSPTPMILHNFYQKSLNPQLRNGAILRSSVRSGTHTFYHFEGNLANAQADRYFDRSTFLSAFGDTSVPTPTTQTTLQKHGALIAQILKRVDQSYLARMLSSSQQQASHTTKLNALEASLMTTVPQPTMPIQLTANELTYWTSGITAQLVCPGDNADACAVSGGRWHVGELFGYAFKLLASGRVRSIGIDFDIHDVHTNRTPFLMNTMAQQSGWTLARLITQLKAAGLYDRTVIAMYTLDGGRSPLLNSVGDGTKNGVVLAGGMINGGYYGDIAVSTNGQVTYRRPDASGNAIATGTTGREMRVPAADVYKTVAKAAGIPDTLVNSLTDVRNGAVLNYMLT